MAAIKCRKCSKRLPERSGPGRPLSYCSTGCRRAVEYEVRRAQKALEALEESLRWHREMIALRGANPLRDEAGLTCCGRKKAEHVVILDVERVGLEARLRVLLEDDEGAVQTVG